MYRVARKALFRSPTYLNSCLFSSGNSSQPKIAILGAGMFGCAMAEVASFQNRSRVTLFTNEAPCVNDINTNHKNTKYHGEHVFNSNVTATLNIAEAVKDAQVVLCCLPVQTIADILQQNRHLFTPSVPFASCSKGMVVSKKKFVSELVRETLGESISFCKISGPSFANEMIKHNPTAVVAASKNLEHAKLLQNLLSNDFFRVYTQDDVIGVEIAGALKNILAIGAGLIEGYGYGLNTKTALLCRGNLEIQKLVKHYGGKFETLNGLAGVGDLVLTAYGQSSRNRTFGFKLAQGETVENILKTSKGVVEGLPTLDVIHEYAQEHGIDMPIVRVIHSVVHGKITMKEAQEILMRRPLKNEF